MSGTYMRDYAHMTPEEIAACIQAASEEPERSPRAWRPSPMLVGVAATTASVMTLLAGAFYLGWLVYGQPDTNNPAIDDSAAYWGEIMSHSAYGVIGIFGGILGLVGVGACGWVGWAIRRNTGDIISTLSRYIEQARAGQRATKRAVDELAARHNELVEAQHEIVAAVEGLRLRMAGMARVADLDEIRAAVETLTTRVDAVSDQLVDALGARNGLRIVRPQAE